MLRDVRVLHPGSLRSILHVAGGSQDVEIGAHCEGQWGHIVLQAPSEERGVHFMPCEDTLSARPSVLLGTERWYFIASLSLCLRLHPIAEPQIQMIFCTASPAAARGDF